MRGAVRTLLVYGGLLLALSSLGALLKAATMRASSPIPAEPSSWNLWNSYVFYLDRGDKAVVYVKMLGNTSWILRVEFTRISDNRTWSHLSKGSVGEPIPVEFVAPRRGVYIAVIEAFSGSGRIPVYTSVGVGDSGTCGAKSTLIYLVVLGVMLAGLGVMLGGGDPSRGSGPLGWELGGMMRHAFMLAMAFILSYAYASFTPLLYTVSLVPRPSIDGVEAPKAYLLFAEHTGVSPPYDIFTILYVYLAIMAVSLYTYEDEKGLIRDSLAAGMGRVELFASKLGAVLVLAITPLLSAHMLLVSLSDPWLLSSHPWLAAWLYARRLVLDSWIIIACLAPILASSMIFRKTLHALLAALLLPYLLEIMAGGAEWLKLRSLFYSTDYPPLTTSPVVHGMWFFVSLALASVILGLASWIYRDNS